MFLKMPVVTANERWIQFNRLSEIVLKENGNNNVSELIAFYDEF